MKYGLAAMFFFVTAVLALASGFYGRIIWGIIRTGWVIATWVLKSIGVNI